MISYNILRKSALILGLSSLGVWGGFTTIDTLNRDGVRAELYRHLRAKVDVFSDKNIDGKVDLQEARDVLVKGYSVDTNRADEILLIEGYRPSIKAMQEYLKAEGKFDKEKDDSTKLSPNDRQIRSDYVPKF